jgi:predicted ATPase
VSSRRDGHRVLTRLTLVNWKNFTKVDFPIGERLFVVGPNASGKTNLLDALLFLRDLSIQGGGLQYAVAKRQGVSAIRCLAARRNPGVTIGVEILDSVTSASWTYTVTFGRVKSPQAEILGESVTSTDGREDDRSGASLAGESIEERRETHLQQAAYSQMYREVRETLAGVEFSHVVPQIVTAGPRYLADKDDPWGANLLAVIARAPAKTRKARLDRIGTVLKLAVPQLESLREHQDPDGRWHLIGRFRHWRHRNARQNELQFSDGTLRLIGILWAVQSGTGPLILEEPELSLHPDIVRHLPALILRVQQATRRRRRQVFISTHSPQLLESADIALSEVLVLRPATNGTAVELATNLAEVRTLVDSGLPLDQVIRANSAPRDLYQLLLPFGPE